MTHKFIDDDEGYRMWLAAYSHGFVLNTTRLPASSYLILHKANCWTIQTQRGKNWTHEYIKICADRQVEIENWVKNEVGGELKPCHICFRS